MTWIQQHWTDVVSIALLVVGAASAVVKGLSPWTSKLGWLGRKLDWVLKLLGTVALNPKLPAPGPAPGKLP